MHPRFIIRQITCILLTLILITIILKVWQHQSNKGSGLSKPQVIPNTNVENDQNEDKLKFVQGRKGEARESLLMLYYLRLYQVIPDCAMNITLKQKKHAEIVFKKKDRSNPYLSKLVAAHAEDSSQCRALQCGPGVGRLRNVLLKAFQKADIVSATRNLLDVSRKDMGPDSSRVERIYNTRLEEFKPEAGRLYDAIWLQGVVSHLADEDLVALLSRLKSALTPISKSTSGQRTPSPAEKSAASRKFSVHLLKQLPIARGGVIIVRARVPRWISAKATKQQAQSQNASMKQQGSQHLILRERPQLKELFARSGLKLLVEWKIDASKTHNKNQMPHWLFVLR